MEGDARQVTNPETYARGLLQGAHDRLASAAPGTRHHTALSEARALGRWIAGYQRAGLDGLTEAHALEALESACTTNGDIAEDGRAAVLKTLLDGLRYGLARPFMVTRHTAPPSPSAAAGLTHRQRRRARLREWFS